MAQEAPENFVATEYSYNGDEDLTNGQREYLRRVARAAAGLRQNLGEIEDRVARARISLDEGSRVGNGGFTLLGQPHDDASRFYDELGVLLDLMGAVGVPAYKVQAVYQWGGR